MPFAHMTPYHKIITLQLENDSRNGLMYNFVLCGFSVDSGRQRHHIFSDEAIEWTAIQSRL